MIKTAGFSICLLVLAAGYMSAADAVLGVASGLSWQQGVGANLIASWGGTWSPASLSPAAWYRAEGNANDSGVTATNGGAWSGSAAYAAGPCGQAFSFGGAAHIAIGNPSNMQTTGDVSVAAWTAPSSFANYRAIFGAGYISGTVAGIGIYNGVSLRAASYRDAAAVATASAAHGSDTNWVHVVGIKRGGALELWTNGVLAASSASTTNVLPNVEWGIGRRKDTTGTWGYAYIGLIDEVLMIPRALTESEIAQLYQWRP